MSTDTDAEFWLYVTDAASWLFYGDLDEYFAAFLKRVFAHEFSDWGFSDGLLHRESPEFAVAYWLLLSELVSLNLAEYGTSPRGAWLTEDGKRFKRIFLEKAAQGSVNWRPDPYDPA